MLFIWRHTPLWWSMRYFAVKAKLTLNLVMRTMWGQTFHDVCVFLDIKWPFNDFYMQMSRKYLQQKYFSRWFMFNESCGVPVVERHLSSFYQQLKLSILNRRSGRFCLFVYKFRADTWLLLWHDRIQTNDLQWLFSEGVAPVALTERIQQGAHFSYHINEVFSTERWTSFCSSGNANECNHLETKKHLQSIN